MRIAQVTPPWVAVPPKGYGGIEWVVASLSDGLVERGHDVTLFATGDSSTKASLRYSFDHASGAKSINSPWYDTVQTLLAFRDPEAFDVYHVHTPWSGLAAGIRSGRPVVHTIHSPFPPEVRALYGELASAVSFVAISDAQSRQMNELHPTAVVYNGIDLDLYPFRPEKEDYLLFLGRASPDKGVLRAVEAATVAGLRLVIALKIGYPEERAHWEDDVRPLLPEGTEVHGEITHDKKAALLAGARAVLFPIDWDEPFGLVMTEAMACGTPVIATPRGSVPEVVADGETGYIVSVENYAEEAAERLGFLDRIDPKACRRRVEQLFSKESMVEGYERVFEKAVAGEA